MFKNFFKSSKVGRGGLFMPALDQKIHKSTSYPVDGKVHWLDKEDFEQQSQVVELQNLVLGVLDPLGKVVRLLEMHVQVVMSQLQFVRLQNNISMVTMVTVAKSITRPSRRSLPIWPCRSYEFKSHQSHGYLCA